MMEGVPAEVTIPGELAVRLLHIVGDLPCRQVVRAFTGLEDCVNRAAMLERMALEHPAPKPEEFPGDPPGPRD